MATDLLPPTLQATVGAGVSPKKLPAHEYAPVTWSIFGKVATTDGTHPSALREMILTVDKDVRIDVEGRPVCGGRHLAALNTKAAAKACRNALLGRGEAHFQIASSEGRHVLVASRLLVFNGGERRGAVKLLIHAYIAAPTPTATIVRVTVERKGAELHTIARIPPIAAGMGSLIDFSFDIGEKRAHKEDSAPYLEARCPDGVFKVNVPKLLFKNEARVPRVAPITVMKGALAVPCTPQR